MEENFDSAKWCEKMAIYYSRTVRDEFIATGNDITALRAENSRLKDEVVRLRETIAGMCDSGS